VKETAALAAIAAAATATAAAAAAAAAAAVIAGRSSVRQLQARHNVHALQLLGGGAAGGMIKSALRVEGNGWPLHRVP
jgi:hypothetical protein